MVFDAWKWLGLAAQVVFASRFAVQWLVSEARGQSVIPTYFWWASILGAAALLAYAIHIHDPVFILGQSFGMLVYVRNLTLRRQRTDPQTTT
jgi:lipid-A-disaccharide synthase-like uncharacterized protein